MATIVETKAEWTVADLARRFGPMPLSRIRMDPAPGEATEQDVLDLNDREDRLCELVNGVLVEKTTGLYESQIAVLISAALVHFVVPRRLGVIAGADGMYRLNPDLIRIPDVSFIPRGRMPKGRMPRYKICPIIPGLAVEILSASNTKKEMAEKLADYFAAGVELVWYVDPKKKSVHVYTAPDQSCLLRESQTLDGGLVLPGFTLSLRELFADPMGDAPPL